MVKSRTGAACGQSPTAYHPMDAVDFSASFIGATQEKIGVFPSTPFLILSLMKSGGRKKK